MSIKPWNRREFLWRSSQSALSLLVLGRSAQQVVAAQVEPFLEMAWLGQSTRHPNIEKTGIQLPLLRL